ncbi:MAG TPA: glycosyl transferase, partial [Pseudorhizobium sp.]|nr:glycosyl transferase [Pseudorhizobium sp.]
NRLIFASPVADHSAHIARMALADLFLDTSPYGAHATATDALSAGLPVLTIPGAGFAPRVCTSMVAAAGVPELICATPEEYVERAIGYANDRESLAAVRRSLEAQRHTSVLQDTPAFARRLEELFWQMQGECERGETPVPDFTNLDVYYEIGAEMLREEVEFEDPQAYRQRYIDKLAKLHDYSPLPHDKRLWRAPDA